eukprot:CAMPEP_0185905796 /NCGR_PEP_ID=MMETSP0196C-20130402/4963_1 /TAXON_ID=2932 /ORGANISM="Alexandrium fundyense, Strain CCMP1719" /LENGTH=57 /DNA_ID=CAMNT_0028625393 /DNA_START=65 /DNA_END=235 /DNA_ORIENTATION=+
MLNTICQTPANGGHHAIRVATILPARVTFPTALSLALLLPLAPEVDADGIAVGLRGV